MSGIEILGIAASVLQIAELGAKLSVKLFVFSRKIKNADKSIDSISQDIAATGAVLQQLGLELGRDEHLRMCSDKAVATTQSLVSDCRKIFLELVDTLDGEGPGSTVVLGWKQRLKYPFLEAQIELLRSNLERLKSSLVVMLNVLIYAGQLKNQETLEVLKDQKELVKLLVEDNNASEKKYRLALKALEYSRAAPAPAPSGATVTATKEPTPIVTKPNPDTTHHHVYALPIGLRYRHTEIQHHCNLIRNLLDEVAAVQYQIDHGFRDRLQRGLLGAYWEEWAPLRELYGDEALIKTFSSHPEMVRFWVSKLEAEALARATGRRNILSIRDLTPVEGWVELVHTGSEALPGPDSRSRSSAVSMPVSPEAQPVFQAQSVFQEARPVFQAQSVFQEARPVFQAQSVFQEARPISPDDSDAVYTYSAPDTVYSAPSDQKPSLEGTENYMSTGDIGRSGKRQAMYEHRYPRNSSAFSTEIEKEHGSLIERPNYEYVSPPNAATKPGFAREDRKESGGRLPIVTDAAMSKSTSPIYPEEPIGELIGQSAGAEDRAGRQAKYAVPNPGLHSGKDPKPTHGKPPVATVGRVGAAFTGLFKNTKRSRRKEVAEEARRKEVEEYSFNPANGPSEGTMLLGMCDDGPSFVISAETTEPTQSQGLEANEVPGNPETIQSTRYANAMVPATPKPSMAERSKYQFESNSSDDDDMNEIDYNLNALTGATKRLNALSRVTGDEVSMQNEHLERIAGKSDRIDDQLGSNIERLKRIGGKENSSGNVNSRTSNFSPTLGTYSQPRPYGQPAAAYGAHFARPAAPGPEISSGRTETDGSDSQFAVSDGSEESESGLTPTRADEDQHGGILPELALGLSTGVLAEAGEENLFLSGSHLVLGVAAEDGTELWEQQRADGASRLVPIHPTRSSRPKGTTHEQEERKEPVSRTPATVVDSKQENDRADALQPHIDAGEEDGSGKGFESGEGGYAAVDKLLMEWTRLSADEYEALQKRAGLDLKS